MREILFKAKRIDNGEWVVGQYVNTCWAKKSVVIGNIFDNPELLQEELNE